MSKFSSQKILATALVALFLGLAPATLAAPAVQTDGGSTNVLVAFFADIYVLIFGDAEDDAGEEADATTSIDEPAFSAPTVLAKDGGGDPGCEMGPGVEPHGCP